MVSLLRLSLNCIRVRHAPRRQHLPGRCRSTVHGGQFRLLRTPPCRSLTAAYFRGASGAALSQVEAAIPIGTRSRGRRRSDRHASSNGGHRNRCPRQAPFAPGSERVGIPTSPRGTRMTPSPGCSADDRTSVPPVHPRYHLITSDRRPKIQTGFQDVPQIGIALGVNRPTSGAGRSNIDRESELRFGRAPRCRFATSEDLIQQASSHRSGIESSSS